MLVRRLLLFIFPFLICTQTVFAGDYVVLLHGMGRTLTSMNEVKGCLDKEGYEVVNIDYPSRKRSVWDLAEMVYQEVQARCTDKQRKIHFVGYSLGCIVTRAMLDRRPMRNLGRVVMLAPPNQGSQLAEFLKNNYIYRSFFGPAGQDLVSGKGGIVHELGPLYYEVGVIAGSMAVDPVSWLILPGSNDGKVTVESTRLQGMQDHIVLPTSHLFIVTNDEALFQTIHFLENGNFLKSPLERR